MKITRAISMLIIFLYPQIAKCQKAGNPFSNPKTEVPVLILPPSIQKTLSSKIAGTGPVTLAAGPVNKMMNVSDVEKLSRRAPLIAVLTPRTPYYSNAMMETEHTYTSTAGNSWFIEDLASSHASLSARLNLSQDKRYLFTIKVNLSGFVEDELISIGQENISQDIHIAIADGMEQTLYCLIQSNKPGWRNVYLTLHTKNSGITIHEWSIKELTE